MNKQRAALPVLPCLCATLRRASRALTQRYGQAFRGLRLRATQFTVLQALSLAGETSQGQLGRMLAMDSTTLTRTLEVLRRRGWIAKQAGHDRRQRRLRLTPSGERQLGRALPRWIKLQLRLRRRLGDLRWAKWMKFSNEVTRAVTE
jgi:DNA-binding MarR family transcriptional regulator